MSSTSWTDVTNYIKTQLKPGVLGHTDVQKILNSILAVINQINAGDFTPTPESIWKADVTYPANTTPVLWQDKWLVSNTANNLGNVPISTAGVVHPTWRVVSASVGSGVDEWEAKVYPNTLEIVFVDGALYYLDREEVGDSPYVSVDFADELLEGVWVSLGGIVPHNSLQGLNQGDYQHLTASELATLQGITRSLDEMGALIRYNFPSKVSGSAGVDANDFVTKSQMENAGYLTSLPAHGHTWSQISDIPTASATTSGILSNTKWEEFNNKIGGNIATGQVAFGIGAGQIGGDAGFLFNATTKVLSTSTYVMINDIRVGRGGSSISTNVAIGLGDSALSDNTTGENNLAILGNSLAWNTTGSNNIGIGRDASLSNKIGFDNVAIGGSALMPNDGGSRNIAIGRQAGFFASGNIQNTRSDNSIFIGFNTGPSAINQTNQIVIGHGAVGNGTNSVTLGNGGIAKTILRGNVGIRTNNPNANLEVEGDSGININNLGEIMPNLYRDGNDGSLLIRTYNKVTNVFTSVAKINYYTGVYTALSDIRLKENVLNSESAIDKILSIKVRKYTWIKSQINEEFGLIAQELHKIFPQYVQKGNGNVSWGIAKAELVPLLIKAIQEQQIEIENLKSKI